APARSESATSARSPLLRRASRAPFERSCVEYSARMRAATRHASLGLTAVVLAAGGSSRLGTPKQLARRRARALLRGAVDAAAAATGRRVIVVVGADGLRLRALLTRSYRRDTAKVVLNAGWRSGLAGSLRR